MGLDMYAYAAARANQREKPREIAYWRKHPSLHGWFQREWESEGNSGDFNGDELEITWAMLERLEYDVLEGDLPETRGFFFGDDASEYYRDQDLEFVKNARAELFMGLKVFYNSSW